MAINWDLTGHFHVAEWGRVSTTIGGTTYYAVRGAGTELDTLFTVEGVTYKADFTLIYKQADFTSIPASGTEITVGGTVYKCAKTEQDSQAKTVKCYMVQRYGRQL